MIKSWAALYTYVVLAIVAGLVSFTVTAGNDSLEGKPPQSFTGLAVAGIALVCLVIVGILDIRRGEEAAPVAQDPAPCKSYTYGPRSRIFSHVLIGVGVMFQVSGLANLLQGSASSSGNPSNALSPIAVWGLGLFTLWSMKNYRLTTTPEGIEVISPFGVRWEAKWADLHVVIYDEADIELHFGHRKAWASSFMAEFDVLKTEVKAHIPYSAWEHRKRPQGD